MNEIIKRATLALAVVLGALTGLGYAAPNGRVGVPTMTAPAAPVIRADAPRPGAEMPSPSRTPLPRPGYP